LIVLALIGLAQGCGDASRLEDAAAPWDQAIVPDTGRVDLARPDLDLTSRPG